MGALMFMEIDHFNQIKPTYGISDQKALIVELGEYGVDIRGRVIIRK
jgi:GGDEF domain-containing protein